MALASSLSGPGVAAHTSHPRHRACSLYSYILVLVGLGGVKDCQSLLNPVREITEHLGTLFFFFYTLRATSDLAGSNEIGLGARSSDLRERARALARWLLACRGRPLLYRERRAPLHDDGTGGLESAASRAVCRFPSPEHGTAHAIACLGLMSSPQDHVFMWAT